MTHKIQPIGVALSLSFAMLSCGFNDDVHQNFLKYTNLTGYKLSSFEFFHSEKPLSMKVLSNGNVEYRYKYPSRGACVTVYEVDPRTGVVLRSDFEGEKADCIWNP